jgi:hypothetical protein
MTIRIVTDSNGRKHITNEPLLHPSKREWVGLTESEVSQIIDEEIGFNSCWGPEEAFAKAIEAKLKEKNEM